MSVVVRDVTEIVCRLYDPNDNFVGDIHSNLQLIDVRVQIKEQSLSGYRIYWKNHIIYIDRNGELSNYPEGFYEEYTTLLLKLV